jgi:hypothetical protein
MPITHLAWRTARPLQPLRKINQLDLVLDANIHDRHLDDVESLSDPCDPFVPPDRGGHEIEGPMATVILGGLVTRLC